MEQENLDKKEYGRQYYEKNKEKIRQYHREWEKKNKEKRLQYWREYGFKKRGTTANRDLKIIGKNTYTNKTNIAILHKTKEGYYYTTNFNDFRGEYKSPIFSTRKKAIEDMAAAL